jgi:peptidoglycan hydrolase-like protein with peptidoglycan-binding domain
MKADDSMCPGHKEYALPVGRKTDPDFDMVAFRSRVQALNAGDPPPPHPVMVDPSWAYLNKGDFGPSVRKLQQLLGVKVDGDFGPKTEAAVKAFQRKHSLVVDGKVGPKTWAALGIK